MIQGTIIRVAGPVVDVQFTAGKLPALQEALTVTAEGTERTMEVTQHVNETTVRCIMLSASEGLGKGMTVTATGHGLTAPVGEATLGRMFDPLGRPIDGKGPVDDVPHCSSLFYAYLPEQNLFAVTSAGNTWHVAQLQRNARVAAAVVLETKLVGKVQGLQVRGRMYRPCGKELAAVKKAYMLRFPYAAAMDLEMWAIAPDYLKLTDNRLGFGKKMIWEADRNEKIG